MLEAQVLRVRPKPQISSRPFEQSIKHRSRGGGGYSAMPKCPGGLVLRHLGDAKRYQPSNRKIVLAHVESANLKKNTRISTQATTRVAPAPVVLLPEPPCNRDVRRTRREVMEVQDMGPFGKKPQVL